MRDLCTMKYEEWQKKPERFTATGCTVEEFNAPIPSMERSAFMLSHLKSALLREEVQADLSCVERKQCHEDVFCRMKPENAHMSGYVCIFGLKYCNKQTDKCAVYFRMTPEYKAVPLQK
jgi:hypothetical protein